MNQSAFIDLMRGIVETHLNPELDSFELAAEDHVAELFSSGTITESDRTGTSEFIPFGDLKTALEWIPLVVACYSIVRGIWSKPGAPRRNDLPSAVEIEAELRERGLDRERSRAVASDLRKAIEQFELAPGG